MALIDRGTVLRLIVTQMEAASLSVTTRYPREQTPNASTFYYVQPLSLMRNLRTMSNGDSEPDTAKLTCRVTVCVGENLANLWAFETACSLLVAALYGATLGDQTAGAGVPNVYPFFHQLDFATVDESAQATVDQSRNIVTQDIAFGGMVIRSQGSTVANFLT